MSENKSRISSHERLRRLPDVISRRELESDGLAPSAAPVALNKWRKAGLVEPVGGWTGLHYNLVSLNCENDPETGRRARWRQVLSLLYPSALAVGAVAYREGGWGDTGRLKRTLEGRYGNPEFAVLTDRRTRYATGFDGVALKRRGRKWYSAVGRARKFETSFGLTLDPAWAVADSMLYGDVVPHSASEIDECLDVDSDAFGRTRDEAIGELAVALDALSPLVPDERAEAARDALEDLADELDVTLPDTPSP